MTRRGGLRLSLGCASQAACRCVFGCRTGFLPCAAVPALWLPQFGFLMLRPLPPRLWARAPGRFGSWRPRLRGGGGVGRWPARRARQVEEMRLCMQPLALGRCLVRDIVMARSGVQEIASWPDGQRVAGLELWLGG